ncbi:V-set domain-containing T-cell activation inhibitor 1-like, partial [Clarias magur]
RAMRRTAAHVWTCVLFTYFLKKTDGRPEEVHVACRYSEACLLPCSFSPSGREEIRWFRVSDQPSLIYSHPPSADPQDQGYVGRTSISTHKLSLGNASLLLQDCVVSDRGRYKCEVSKGEKKHNVHVTLKVEALIRSVDVEITRLSGYEEIKCTTDDVYPAPHVFWYTDPPMEKLQYTTRKTANEEGLYRMESKLKKLVELHNITYICTINSSSAAQTWTASLSETVLNNATVISKLHAFSTWTEVNSAEGQDITIPCRTSWNLQNFTLTWFFTKDQSTVICTYDSRTQQILNRWNGTARLEPQRLQQGDGSLRLKAVQSQEHAGVYTCNISALQWNHVGQTRVKITSPSSENETSHSPKPWWIPLVVVMALVFIMVAAIIAIVKVQNVTVTCLFSRDCVLPCTSTYHHFIQWSKSGKAVHTFDSDEGHLENQDAAFKDRTSLFTDQVSQGNASLLIRGVRVEDEGIYTCYTSSGSEDLENIVWLNVKEMVDIYSGDDAKIRCPVSRGDAEIITLRFGNSSTILESQQTNITVQWRGTDVHLGHDGNVTLHNLDMNNHTGNYTCERSTARSRFIVRTTVHIIPDIHKSTIAESHSVAVAGMSVLSLLIYWLCSRN